MTYFKYHYTRANDCMKIIYWDIKTCDRVEILAESVTCKPGTESRRGDDPMIYLEGIAAAITTVGKPNEKGIYAKAFII